ncbi:MAG TPA: Gfo/Idh/MocA family oxidoreductase [Acetobacteraceae bacterium]|nr:Gfo/Idh/MocA family oxidoreductase [Acetobacteraceae bacterium]
MRIVLTGVAHWHTPFYLDPLLTMPDVAVVGVSDPDLARAEEVAAKAHCPAFARDAEMCARLKPDFAFALGRHCDMADVARRLIEQRIPFAMEKPCAVTAADAHDIAARAAQAKLFAAVPFVIRYSPLVETIRQSGTPQYVAFKFVGGMVDRYHQQRVEWMLHRATAGGGALLNLGVHFLDMCRVLLPDVTLQVIGAAMSNRFSRLDIEDHAIVLMRGGDATCSVETGYLYPAPNSVFDLHYSIRTERHHFAARDNQTLEILDNDRKCEVRSMPLTNSAFYPTFVTDTLRRVQRGELPIADLNDMAAAMDLVEAAYAASPLTPPAAAPASPPGPPR